MKLSQFMILNAITSSHFGFKICDKLGSLTASHILVCLNVKWNEMRVGG